MPTKAILYHILFVASVLWPAIVICRRAGIKPLWALSLCVPVFGMVIYACALAFQPWSKPSEQVDA